MKRGETSKIYKNVMLIGLVVLFILGCIYVLNYTPAQTIEVGEYKSYKMK